MVRTKMISGSDRTTPLICSIAFSITSGFQSLAVLGSLFLCTSHISHFPDTTVCHTHPLASPPTVSPAPPTHSFTVHLQSTTLQAAVMSAETYHSITLEEGFRCQPVNLYEALTDQKLISAYTQSPATTNLTPGGQFSYFDGQISGTYTTLTPPTTIVQQLRFKEWNDADTSTLTLTLTPLDRTTTRLTLTHTNIPETRPVRQ